MNRTHFISVIFSVLLAVVSSFATAAEVVGTPVAPQTDVTLTPQALTQQATSSIANAEAAANELERAVQDEIRTNLPPVPFKSFEPENDFNEFVLIPIISVIVVFGGGFAFVIYWVILRNRAAAQRRVQHQEQIQRFIDAGRDVPDILLRDTEGYSSQTNLAKGIKDTLIGLAIVVFLTVLVGFDIGAAGLIIVAAGLARIIIWKLTQDKNS